MGSWTAEQVAALSPDTSSLVAARDLTGSWSGTGATDSALWGRCQGSGSKPYRTIVDLDGPAYECSCPSRKTPCKHALGLMLSWVDGAVPQSDSPADFAATWLREHTGKALAKQRTPNPQTAEQRIRRVTVGLDELDVWLTDQIRTGLAQADKSYREFDAIAARMVDAQAPGVARVLRRLPYTVATYEDWPRRLLAEYAQLHLLVKAHRQIDELPPGLRAAVRSHIGYPTPTDSVRAEPPVRDRWMVLGVRITEENLLYTRKAWLRGRDRRRWAVLLDFSYSAPDFPPDVPATGEVVDADLHYYPGSALLRAQIGRRHAPPEPFTTLQADSMDTALRDYASAVGNDPWVRTWPVVLGHVVPTSAGVVDEHGAALPLDGDRHWRLLAASGGHPVTVVGEWNGQVVTPVSVFTAAEVVNL